MRFSFTITFVLLLFCSGCNKSTGVVVDDTEYHQQDEVFIQNLLELNTELNSDTLEARITKIVVIIDETEYYRISAVSLNNLGLSDLPTSISYLDSLTTLDISNNQLLDLPDAICSLDVIDGDEFLFNDNHLCEPSALPSCIIEIIDYTEQKCDVAYDENDYQFIQEIIVANEIDTNGVNAVNEIYDNVHWTDTENKNEFDQFILRITKIEWDNKNISEIPATIGLLDSLKFLELENNNIETIPGTIGNLKKLELIQLYGQTPDGLKNLPEGIGNLTNLQVLHVHNNVLESLDFSFEQLTSLSEFWIQKNELISLPQSLCTLISSGSLEVEAFHYYGNNICTSVDACDLSISEQERGNCE